MKKLLIILLGLFLVVGFSCKHAKINTSSEIDTTVLINDSFMVVYDMVTGKDTLVRIISEYEVGDMRIDDNGDTLFYVPDCVDVTWVSAEEWHGFWEKQFKMLLDERKERRIE